MFIGTVHNMAENGSFMAKPNVLVLGGKKNFYFYLVCEHDELQRCIVYCLLCIDPHSAVDLDQ